MENQESWSIVPIAIRPEGEPARVHIPDDLTPAEAEKIARVVIAYATNNSVSGNGRPATGVCGM